MLKPRAFDATEGHSRADYRKYGEETLRIGQDPARVLLQGIADPDEIMRCAQTLVTAMGIPGEYWKRWTQSLFSLTTTFDMMRQLVHAEPPMVRSMRSINQMKPEMLKNPKCMMLDNKWHADNRPNVPVSCTKAGEMQYGADGTSLFIMTESGKWLAVANTDGRPFRLPQKLADEAQADQWNDTFTMYSQARTASKLAGQAYPSVSELGQFSGPTLKFESA